MVKGVAKAERLNTWWTTVFTGFLFLFSSIALSAPASDDEAIQRNAMALATTGNYPQSISSLEALRKRSPENRSIKRDLMTVYAWAEQCSRSLRIYRSIQPITGDGIKPALAAGECLVDQGFYLEAIALLTPLAKKNKYDKALQDLYVRARNERDSQKHWFNYNGLEIAQSDAGSSKTVFESELFRRISDSVTIYGRINLQQEHEPVLADGSLKRIGVGLDYKRIGGVKIRGEVSGSLETPVNAGWLGRIDYDISNNVVVKGEYASYAEDIPLPAIALGIHSDRITIGSNFHSSGYVIEGSAAINQYLFSDNNTRRGAQLDIAHAYHRVPDRWRRYGLAIGHEQNTQTGVAYFNPSEANTIHVYHSWEFPKQTRFKLRKDLLTVRAGLFAQAGYQSDFIGEVAYRQKYTVTDNSWMEVGASIASNVYDGSREAESALQFSYARSF